MGDEDVQRLFDAATLVKTNSYSPYSKFRVGVALLCKDGTIFTGCNVENVAYPLGLCAEKAAIAKAVSEGYRNFAAILVTSDLKDAYCSPCGACRQFCAEFGTDWTVYIAKPDGSCIQQSIAEILPLNFQPEYLNEEKITPQEIDNKLPNGFKPETIENCVKTNVIMKGNLQKIHNERQKREPVAT